MNIITVADIKRSGFAALDGLLAIGPVHLMKRNRPGAVLLHPDDYAQLLAQAQHNAPPLRSKALDILLQQDAVAGGLDAAGMQARRAEAAEGWVER
jgi:PHD/YefM family antitoxin component YafN of YafNO toxin-antitoxin module